ncbi:MAG: hypothetical protein SFY68_15205 [Candidatus Sumerlaeia bacterium]|nr:hypothetical protein [Candidatus Sumerlaeia bacterium]
MSIWKPILPISAILLMGFVLKGFLSTAEPNRTELYTQAMEEGAKRQDSWPKSQEELVQEFWKCIQENRLEEAILYAPGSAPSDFAPYRQLGPGPLQSIGAPMPHPLHKDKALLPITVGFERMTHKTILLAFTQSPDNRLHIDPKNSIWW